MAGKEAGFEGRPSFPCVGTPGKGSAMCGCRAGDVAKTCCVPCLGIQFGGYIVESDARL